jgi:hypothetical protein
MSWISCVTDCGSFVLFSENWVRPISEKSKVLKEGLFKTFHWEGLPASFYELIANVGDGGLKEQQLFHHQR